MKSETQKQARAQRHCAQTHASERDKGVGAKQKRDLPFTSITTIQGMLY